MYFTFSSHNHRRDYVFPKIHCVTLQEAAHSAGRCTKDTLLSLTSSYHRDDTLAEQRGFCLPLLSEVGELNTTAQVRLDQGFPTAAAQLAICCSQNGGMGREKEDSCIALSLGSERLIWRQ